MRCPAAPASLLPALALTVISGCSSSEDAAPGDGPRVGFDVENAACAPEPVGPMTTPSGRVVEAGSTDELGFILPLDVKRSSHRETDRPPLEFRPPAPRGSRRGAFDEERLSPDDGATQNETTIDVDGQTVVAGWNAYTAGSVFMGVARSPDGGATWVGGLIQGHAAMSDPSVKAGGGGRWYYGYLARGGPSPNYEIYVRRSTDDGVTWGDPTAVTSGPDFDDKPYVAARGDEVLVGWADFGFSPAKVSAARSIDGGVSFDEIHVLAGNSVGGNGACPVIDPDGDYFMFWRDSFQESLWVSVSTDQGMTWSEDRGIVDMSPLPSSLPPGFRMVNLPSAAANPLTGDLVVVWNDQRFGDPDVLSIRSTDKGATWSGPVRVNDDAGGEDQFFPWIAFDETAVAHVVWYDRREDGFNIDVYYTRSTDGGVTFEPNVRVTEQAFPPVLPWEGGAPDFIGDYNGIAATSAWAYPCYQDSREGNQDIYVARVPGGAANAPEAPPVAAARRLRASPSPYTRVTTIYGSAREANAEVVLYGPKGNLVRALRLGGDAAAEWDGRDARGRALPAGVYFARPRDGGGEALRIVKLD